MSTSRTTLFVSCLALAACGGGGTAGSSTGATGSVQVLLDTAAGADAFVQVQVAAAALLRSDGSQTGNLLGAPRQLTVSDPSGEPEGLLLRSVPPGSYTELHLALVPGSGYAIQADGSRSQVEFSGVDFAVPLGAGVSHDGSQATWLEVHHGAGSRFVEDRPGHVSWSPNFGGGPAAGSTVTNGDLRVSSVDDNGIHGTLGGLDDSPVHLRLEQESELFDDHGNHVGEHQSFVAGVGAGHHLTVAGVLDDHGGLRGQRVRHDSGSDDSARLLGRITDLAAGSGSFGLDVVASVSHHEHAFLPTIEHVTVLVGSAPIHQSRDFGSLSFAQLQVGDLVKISVSSRSGSDVTAREVEVEAHRGETSGPEIEGEVGSVQVSQGQLVVVPRGDDPLIVGGQSVASVVVRVTSGTRIERDNGSSSLVIGLGDISTRDRINIRGSGSSGGVDATWIRVR